MSGKSSNCSITLDPSKANLQKEKYEPVFVPDVFKKTREQKIGDQSKILSKLQNLMQDIRHKES